MAANLVVRLTGGSANSNPLNSIGGLTSSTLVSDTPLHNLFDKVTESERAAGSIEYRAVDIVNIGDSATTEQSIYILSNTTSTDTEIAIGYDSTAGSHATGTSLETIASETTAPSNPVITFTQPTQGSPLSLPSIVASQAIRLWIRWTVDAGSTSFPSDSATIRIAYM